MARTKASWGRKPITWERNENGCLICTSHAGQGSGRYPSVQITGTTRRIRINRLICLRRGSRLPFNALHSCDTPMCINPAHIRPGTHRQNMREMMTKGRGKQQKGSKCGKAKINEQLALEIFNAAGTLKEIGARFGVAFTTVHDIKTKRTWRHIHEKSPLRSERRGHFTK